MKEIEKLISELRHEYTGEELSEDSVSSNPVEQFSSWFSQALEANVSEPNAMSLATVSSDCKPSIRIVLLKGFDERGFIFYTNYESRKGEELAANPHASVCFFWHELERQVRIEGTVKKLSAKESDTYFETRPEGSKLGAWISPQSRTISKEFMEQRKAELAEKFNDKISRPPYWGGYILQPHFIEFWQGRPDRLHDRICYKLEDKNWKIFRIAP
jgi:pyridoxamine 5'-phosphate oxidase